MAETKLSEDQELAPVALHVSQNGKGELVFNLCRTDTRRVIVRMATLTMEIDANDPEPYRFSKEVKAACMGLICRMLKRVGIEAKEECSLEEILHGDLASIDLDEEKPS